MEKQIRKALEAEFKNRTDQALDLIKRENEANEIAFQEKQADLMKKRDEAEAETAQSEAEMPVEETPTEEAPAIEVEQPAAEEVAPEETEAEEPAEQPEEAVEPAFWQ